ncbi:hypothetical protein A2592_03440 [Candidatus Kaiserbacteria bacterium RIFOXYD1_FULL_42_15]|uniref:Uncharacterized protein n=1 Tax=Candidatus Kaiserbacteria bacterium RIFOXYD1_FULL_42_15 TaxID=1798532 RepID=A0A1F6FPF8_9BACT|nr:MAG: hypothetical protein A2592_03440 [Candidatus Kaiserbacteria bacterium RIFOXYD1_FULL_42_15]
MISLGCGLGEEVDRHVATREDEHDDGRGLPRFPLTGTVHLVALFTKELARSCESPLDFLTRKDVVL